MTGKVMGTAIVIAATMSAAFQLLLFPANAQGAGPSASTHTLSSGSKFVERSGEELFANACQGCHMGDGNGATGAGAYPSLAHNSNLESAGYPITIILNGQRAMPAFGLMMSDDQVAEVVNYVRTHFGNRYQDAVIAEDVRAARR
jgi:mono/diheme cytochrome c family protein